MQPPSGAPRRLIGIVDATALVVGSMIGSGIFIVSAESARLVGTPGRLLAVWALAGALTLLAANACAELATMFPLAGGPYVFFREAYGPLAGFLFGWTMALVIQTGTIAAVAVAFAKFLGILVPSVAGGATKAVAASVVLALTATNALGLKAGTRVQNVLTVLKVAALVTLTAGGIVFGRTGADAPAGEAPFSGALVLAFALALQAAWALVLVLSGTYSDLLRYVVAVEFVVLILLVLAVSALRRRLPARERPYRAWGHPGTSALFVCLAGAVVILLAIASPRTTLPGFGLVLLGIPVFFARSKGHTA